MSNAKTVELGEVCKIVMGQSPPSSSYNTAKDGLPFFQGKTDFGELYPTARYFCNEPTRVAYGGDVLISVRAPVGPTNLAREQCCIGRGLSALQAQENLDSIYLLFFLRYFEPQLARLGQGSTFEAVNRDDLETLQIPLPAISEQKRVAVLLEQADRLRRTRRYALELSDTFLPAAFLELFGDHVRNPKGFRITELGEFLSFVTSGSRGWAEYYVPNGDRFIRSLDVKMNYISDEDAAFVNAPEGAEADRACVRTDDVLLTITGSQIGRVAPVPARLDGSFVSQHVAILRLKPGFLPVFVSMFMSLKSCGQREIARLQYGQTKPGLSLGQISEFKISVPPLPLQQKFATLVERHERLRATQREALRQAEHLFQTLLHRAFNQES